MITLAHGTAALLALLRTRLLRTHPFAPDARQRPGKTPVRTALSPRYLIRMRSQVQVLAGPPQRHDQRFRWSSFVLGMFRRAVYPDDQLLVGELSRRPLP